MNCVEARERMSDIDGDEGARADELRAHTATCEACAAEWAELEATVGLLRRAGNEPLPDGFALSLHNALVAAGAPEKRWLDRVRAAIAMRPMTFAACAASFAAILSVAATLQLAHRSNASSQQQAIAYRVPESKVALVKIDFVAEKAIEDVAFEITLPDGLRFVSGGQQLAERTFRFQGRLNAGDNSIPIAVKGPRAGRYKVIAHAIGPTLDVTQEVVLEVTT